MRKIVDDATMRLGSSDISSLNDFQHDFLLLTASNRWLIGPEFLCGSAISSPRSQLQRASCAQQLAARRSGAQAGSGGWTVGCHEFMHAEAGL